jgi:hypothetical protein
VRVYVLKPEHYVIQSGQSDLPRIIVRVYVMYEIWRVRENIVLLIGAYITCIGT